MAAGNQVSFQYSYIRRAQVLLTSVVTCAAACLFLIPDFPFPAGYLAICILSSSFHLALFIGFRRATPMVFNLANIANLVMLAASVHYTGGIMSPFTAVFILVLVSGSGYGVKMPMALGLSAGLYAGIVLAEKSGVLPSHPLSSADIYESWPATLFVLTSVLAFMASTSQIYRETVNNLREKIEEEMSLKANMAARLAKLDAPSQVGLLVQKVVHDVNGPLTAIAGSIQLIQEEENLRTETAEDCRIALGEVRRVSALLNRMLQYVKPGDNEREVICPRDVVSTVLAVIRFHPAARGVTVESNLPPANSFSMRVNKDELQQILFNIIKNAMEAVPEGLPERRVRIDMSCWDRFARITVSDTGAGFPDTVLTTAGRIAKSTKNNGNGIGLVVARELIEANGGSLTLSNAPGRGAIVTVIFPIWTSDQTSRDRGQAVHA